MRARSVIGRKIVGLEQERTINSAGEVIYDVKGLLLDNGDRILLIADETENSLVVTALLYSTIERPGEAP